MCETDGLVNKAILLLHDQLKSEKTTNEVVENEMPDNGIETTCRNGNDWRCDMSTSGYATSSAYS